MKNIFQHRRLPTMRTNSCNRSSCSSSRNISNPIWTKFQCHRCLHPHLHPHHLHFLLHLFQFRHYHQQHRRYHYQRCFLHPNYQCFQIISHYTLVRLVRIHHIFDNHFPLRSFQGIMDVLSSLPVTTIITICNLIASILRQSFF